MKDRLYRWSIGHKEMPADSAAKEGETCATNIMCRKNIRHLYDQQVAMFEIQRHALTAFHPGGNGEHHRQRPVINIDRPLIIRYACNGGMVVNRWGAKDMQMHDAA